MNATNPLKLLLSNTGSYTYEASIMYTEWNRTTGKITYEAEVETTHVLPNTTKLIRHIQ